MSLSLLSGSAIALLFLVALNAAVRYGARLGDKEEAMSNVLFIKDRQEYLSIWALAHEWVGIAPTATSPEDIPADVRRFMDKVIIAYFRKELTLRKRSGYRLVGHRFIEKAFGLDRDFDKLWTCLTPELDIQFLDGLYVMRSELLRWCPNEFIDPPACWTVVPATVNEDSESVEGDGQPDWLVQLTEQRRSKVACLEVARHLWKLETNLLYEEVRNHSTMRAAGLNGVFSKDSFKTWARWIAPEEAKRGGNRKQSIR